MYYNNIYYILYIVKKELDAQSCPALCDHMDCSPPGFSIHGFSQARTLEWVAISFSNVWKWKVKVKSLSRVRLLVTPWIAAYQAPRSMEFSKQEYWSGVPLPSPTPKTLSLRFDWLLVCSDLGISYECIKKREKFNT